MKNFKFDLNAEAFFSACCEDVKYTQSQEYFADFAENN